MNADRQAIVIGGSLAGLFTGVLLRSIGWQVDIYERSPRTLSSRGGGVVLQPDVVEAFRRAGIPHQNLGVVASERYYLQRNGSIQRMPMRQTLTSWNSLYNSLKRHFPDEHYHQGKSLINFQQNDKQVTAIFADGTQRSARSGSGGCVEQAQATGDLLVGADGLNSTVRQLLLPTYAPMYAGYVAYRGLVDEGELDRETAAIMTERFVFYQFRNSHILQYVIPGENESLVPGERRFNWVWYVNYDENTELPNVLTDKNGKRHDYSIPPGMMANDIENEMRQYAERVLVPPFQKLIAATKEPFVQAILDLGVPNMAFDRVALVGDAAFIPRPHTAASVSKAAANAIALADALVEHDHDVLNALKAWEGEQLTLGMNLWKRGRDLGETSQFVYGKNRWEK